jgi:hypothetical protein
MDSVRLYLLCRDLLASQLIFVLCGCRLAMTYDTFNEAVSIAVYIDGVRCASWTGALSFHSAPDLPLALSNVLSLCRGFATPVWLRVSGFRSFHKILLCFSRFSLSRSERGNLRPRAVSAHHCCAGDARLVGCDSSAHHPSVCSRAAFVIRRASSLRAHATRLVLG